MARVLAISDEVEESFYSAPCLQQQRADVVVACGDLPFEYLEFVVTTLNVPLLYVLGNHDPDIKVKPEQLDPSQGLRHAYEKTMDFTQPGPQGCQSIDGHLVEAAGLTFGGLGGSVRYSAGPNQYTQRQMRRRAMWLATRARLKRSRVDVLVTHSPPRGIGDDDDPAHEGFAAFHGLVARLSPRVLVHGHIHPHGRTLPDYRLNGTSVINAVGHRVIELGLS